MNEALEKDLKTLKEVIDYDFLFDVKMNQKNIVRYYKKNKYIFYRLMSKNKNGMMHMGLSDDGKCIKGKFYGEYQVNFIDSYIRKNKCTNILEIGSGQGANLLYLASQNKNCSFYGIDLYPSIDKKRNNITLYEGDYHHLKQIKDNSVDLIYAIETLCYSKNKNQVFKEVNRVLKKGGLFILFDGYANKKRDNLSPLEKEVFVLTERGWVLECFEYVHNLDKYIEENGFKIIKKENLKEKLQSHVDFYKERLDRFFKTKFLFRILSKCIPKEILGNLIPVYLLSNGIKYDLCVYYVHVLKKK